MGDFELRVPKSDAWNRYESCEIKLLSAGEVFTISVQDGMLTVHGKRLDKEHAGSDPDVKVDSKPTHHNGVTLKLVKIGTS